MRHGQTDWNATGKLQGRSDVPLNDNGRLMAEAAIEEYKDIQFDICFCSPLKRARETAEIFLKNRNIQIIYDDRLKEMSFGIYEGVDNIRKMPDCPINTLFDDPENYKGVPDGETFEQLFQRTGGFIEEIIKPALKDNKNILVIAHGGVNLSIIAQLKNIPLKDFWNVGLHQCKLVEIK